MVSSLGIIGRTGEGVELNDGQTVKTKVLIEELMRLYPGVRLNIVDTYDYKHKIIRIIRQLIYCMKNSQIIFVLLSKKGRIVLFPIIFSLNLFYRKPILHDVIGGASDELIQKHKWLKFYYNRFSVNWVESIGLKSRLENMGVMNVEYLPNFKRLPCIKKEEISMCKSSLVKFCTFSRVTETKGIGRAAKAVVEINASYGKQVAVLDIYGPVEGDYAETLNDIINNSDGAVRYKGVIAYDKSVGTLKNYDILLFPTLFPGEGFPGTLIDAMSSGLPVIATDWHLNSEIIVHGVTGYLYPWQKPEKLKELMEYLMDNPALVFEMRKHCLEEAKKYAPEIVMERINQKIVSLIG